MARITQYPEETSPSANDVVLIDGVNGSRKVKVPSILNGIVAPVETSSTSSRAYAVGDQFIFNGVTTEATSVIAQGETIVVGNSGNAKVADCVLDQISQLKDVLNDKVNVNDFTEYKESYYYGYSKDLSPLIYQAIESSFQAANNYSLFQGFTMSASEGGWYGFKHTTAKPCSIIYIDYSGIAIVYRSVSGQYSSRYIMLIS